MSNKKCNLIVCAHPDDESIYFSGLVMQNRQLPWTVICVTDGDADKLAESRKDQFLRACKSLEVNKCSQWNFPDIYEQRLDVSSLSEKLKSFQKENNINLTYTHGIIGEYGHPHHQDVSFATHQSFKNVLSISYNCYPDQVIQLTQQQYQKKTQILQEIYGSEINKFAHLVAGTWQEGFHQTSLDEIENIYNFLIKKDKLEKSKLLKYSWLYKHIQDVLGTDRSRIF